MTLEHEPGCWPDLPPDQLDALLAEREGPWWSGFYQDRAKPCPFFVPDPDESLAAWVADGTLPPGKALDLGCGHGRNTLFLARQGFAVQGVDYAAQAIAWAQERAAEAGVEVTLTCSDVFDLVVEAGSCDLVYDSGCFHHIAPHRRRLYVERVARALKPGGWFGLTCFRPEGGSGRSDAEVYQHRSMGGGLGYTEERLRAIWSTGELQVRAVRQMREPGVGSGLFGASFLWVMLAQKACAGAPEQTPVQA